MDLWFHETTPKIQQSILNAEERSKSFAEVVNGFSKQNAQHEANRCFSCGNCFECDGCYGVCPEKAIEKLGAGKRYCFDRDLCTGCRACARECPCTAIAMKSDEEKE
jgi:Pyruvate/2-oxoacid:ferredoxin oxidoreductase delta subunit